jgi:RNA polymerase sigma factor (sigma-70 family)
VTENEIYEGIVRKDNRTFLWLYRQNEGRILNLVQNNNGNEDDARDIFQEGLVALWTNISKGKFDLNGQAKISTYLFTLCRNLWISKLRKNKKMFSLDDNPGVEIADEVNDMEEQYEKVKTLEDHFAKLGEACQQLLSLFYYKKASLKEIADLMGITDKTAKNNKYRCMQQLKELFEPTK